MSEKNHSFSPSVAREFGVPEAVAIHAFQWWIGQHRDKGEFNFEGRYWCYYSVENLAKEWPYFSPDQVRRLIESLLKQGVLIRGYWWKEAGWKQASRVTWFAFSDQERFLGVPCGENAKSIWQNRQMDLAKSPNGSGKKPKSYTKESFHDSIDDKHACMRAQPQNSAPPSPPAAAAAAVLSHGDSDPAPTPVPTAGIPAQIDTLSPLAARLRAVFRLEPDDAALLGARCPPEHLEPLIARAGQLAAKEGLPVHQKAGFVRHMILAGKAPPKLAAESGAKGGAARSPSDGEGGKQAQIESWHRHQEEQTRQLRRDLRHEPDAEAWARQSAEIHAELEAVRRQMGRRP